MANFFTKEASRTYDEKNSRLAPIADNMHFLIGLILEDLPQNARVLCVGVGTGAEILSLAKTYPEWTFVGVDPSGDMLDVCKQRVKEAGIAERCEFIEGYVQDVPEGESYDAVLSVLVGHFVQREERTEFYTHMHARLRPGGYVVDTEISFDLDSQSFPYMLQNWERIQTRMGASPDSLRSLPSALKDVLAVLAPADVEERLRSSGFDTPVRFFQSFMITGWFAVKR